MLKIIIAGGRDYSDYKRLETIMDNIIGDRTDVEIVTGMASGADFYGLVYANRKGLPVAKFPANWDKYGKSAGFRRNSEMGQYADVLVAFWDYNSRGTKHMIDLMKAFKKPMKIFKY